MNRLTDQELDDLEEEVNAGRMAQDLPATSTSVRLLIAEVREWRATGEK